MQSATTCSNEFKSMCINKGFMILEEKMLGFGYHYVVNSMDHILFQKKNNDYDFFEIRISNDKIFVSVPIKKSRFQYKTHFLSYFEASEYVEMQLNNFESNDQEVQANDEQVSNEQVSNEQASNEQASKDEDNE